MYAVMCGVKELNIGDSRIGLASSTCSQSTRSIRQGQQTDPYQPVDTPAKSMFCVRIGHVSSSSAQIYRTAMTEPAPLAHRKHAASDSPLHGVGRIGCVWYFLLHLRTPQQRRRVGKHNTVKVSKTIPAGWVTQLKYREK